MCVVLARFGGHEPSLFDEDLRQTYGRFPISDAVGSQSVNLPRCDCVLRPPISEPILELFDRRVPAQLFNRLFDRRRPSLIQSFK
jgi:hypothetical protein